MALDLSELRGKRVLVTGNTGFKGAWLTELLLQLGCIVHGASTCTYSNSSVYKALGHDQRIKQHVVDISSQQQAECLITSLEPECIFHLAAQPIVRQSYSNPHLTFSTNSFGTLNILEALRISGKPVSAVFITSDKCYQNNEWIYGYRENDRLGGDDPYSASKALAEIIIATYCRSYETIFKQNDIRISSVRAGNVIGGGDFSPDRLVPDIIRSWQMKMPLQIRSPHSTRPWQHVLDPLSGYLKLMNDLLKRPDLSSESFNFGPSVRSIQEVKYIAEYASKCLGVTIDYADCSPSLKEARLLTLSCDKSAQMLGWHPSIDLDLALDYTFEWHKTLKSDPSELKEVLLRQASFILL